jgi:hypothetical protein
MKEKNKNKSCNSSCATIDTVANEKRLTLDAISVLNGTFGTLTNAGKKSEAVAVMNKILELVQKL